MYELLQKIFQSLLQWVFPIRHSEHVVYALTPTTIETLPRATPLETKDTYSLFSYKNPNTKSLIWEIKYHKNTEALSLIAPLLADVIQDEYTEKSLFYNWDKCFLVPIPSTQQHINERGYAHTQFICDSLITLLPKTIHYRPNLLIKVVTTPTQHKLTNRNLRLTNLKNTYATTETINPHTLIILIDDVTTTGATLVEARRALTNAGATDIIAFTIAH